MPKCFLFLLLFGSTPVVIAQGSAIFPDSLRRALREEVTFQRPPTPEPEPEAGNVATWNRKPYRTPVIIGASLVVSVGLAFLLYRMYRDLRLVHALPARESGKSVRVDSGTYPEQDRVETGVSPELVARAEASGQYAVAVRLAYLGLLHDLSRTGLLRYQSDFSNADYLEQLQPGQLRDALATVTRHYEHYWYGNYPLDRLSYRMVRKSIAALRQQMVADA